MDELMRMGISLWLRAACSRKGHRGVDTAYSILHEQSSSVILSLSQESIPYPPDPPAKQEALYSLEPQAC